MQSLFVLFFPLLLFSQPEETTIYSGDEVPKDCVRIYVEHPDGTKHTNAKVSGDVCYGEVTDYKVTNYLGYADICFSINNSLCAVFIESKEYTNRGSRFKKGNEYTIKIR